LEAAGVTFIEYGEHDMKVELTRFRIKPDKLDRADEWLRVMNERVSECVETLKRE
jgi:Family of unknown function (DUF6176)